MKGHPLRRLLAFCRPHRGRTVLATLCSIGNKVFDLAPPALIGAAVEVVVRREDSIVASLGVSDVRHQLYLLTAITVLVFVLESSFEYAYARTWRNLAQTVQHELRLMAYRHVQGLELAYFEDRSTGGLMTVLGDDVNQLERFLDSGANDLIQVATTVVVIGGSFFLLSPTVAWLAVLPMPFVLWGAVRLQHRIAPRYAAVRDRAGDLNSLLSGNLGGIATIKSFTAEEREAERVRAESETYRSANRRSIALSAAFSPLIRMVILAGFAAILLLGGLHALDGRLALGAYSVMVFLSQRLLWPLARLGNTLDLYQRAMASTRRILDLVDTPPGIRGGTVELPRRCVAGEIAFEDVTFAYPGNPPVLSGLSFRIGAGETVGVVGLTGSGKTTLVKLLLRFYDVAAGSVRLDGRDVRDLTLRSLRDAIGFVSQDVFLFHGTVRENVAYGDVAAPFERLLEAARIAEADAFVDRLPLGWDTVVGERGQKLSGGQRQRLSIARAVLKDPPVLVLDEATSSVDNETEAAIQRSLDRIAVGRTTILIAHRLSTVRHADRILVLEAGALVEEGTHEELVAADGIYASLWRVQTGQAEPAASDRSTGAS